MRQTWNAIARCRPNMSQFRLHGAPNSVDPQGEHTQTSPATSSDTRD